MALPRERTFVYHQPEAVAALISSGEAHFQHSPSRGGKRELGAEGAASLSTLRAPTGPRGRTPRASAGLRKNVISGSCRISSIETL